VGDWSYFLVHAGIIVLVVFLVFRRFLPNSSNLEWPTAEAEILGAKIVRIRRDSTDFNLSPECGFVNYSFVVDGQHFGGTFALSGNIDVLTAVTRVIRGKWMSVRYDPKDPNNSVVVEPLDEYFRGLMPTQAFHVMQYEPEESIFELPAPPQSGKRE
jgi:hypothetical protein